MAKPLKKLDFSLGTLLAYLIPRSCRSKRLHWPSGRRDEVVMTKYQVKVDPNLNVNNRAFGARIVNGDVFIPSKLAQALKQHPTIGEDPVTIAGFLASFPTAVVGYLGLSPGAVMQSVEAFIELLEQSGADVTSVRRRVPRHSYGARHPGHLNH